MEIDIVFVDYPRTEFNPPIGITFSQCLIKRMVERFYFFFLWNISEQNFVKSYTLLQFLVDLCHYSLLQNLLTLSFMISLNGLPDRSLVGRFPVSSNFCFQYCTVALAGGARLKCWQAFGIILVYYCMANYKHSICKWKLNITSCFRHIVIMQLICLQKRKYIKEH